MKPLITSTDRLNVALRYGTLGYCCLPLIRGTKRAAVPWKRFRFQMPSQDQCKHWFGFRTHDIALLTGAMIVFDCDDPNFFAVVTARCGTTPMICQTPRGGRHFYYRPQPGLPLGNRIRIEKMPIDLRAEGGYVVAPWSTNAEGVPYRWLSAGPVAITDLPLIYDGWIRADATPQPKPLIKYGHRPDRARSYLASIEGAISGQGGHNRTMRVAGVLIQKFGLSIEEAMPLFLEWNRRCEPPWSEKELLHKLQDAWKNRTKSGAA